VKKFLIFISFLCLLSSLGTAQVEPYGLDSLIVTDLRFYAGELYACTDSHGVFKRSSADTGWIPLGLEGKRIETVYPHQVGALDFAITVGIKPSRPEGDSTLVRCWYNQSWNITDTGMNHEDTWEIGSIDGIPTPAICGETFAAGSGKVYRKKTTVWEKVFEGAVVNVVRVSPNYEIWIGGETMIFWPFLAKSTDIGDTWTMMYPNLAGDNACNSIAFDPSDSNIVYAGMEGVVIKTTDGGLSWNRTGLTGAPFYMRGVAVDPLEPSHIYAGGIAVPDSFGLYESTDAGENWQSIIPPTGTKGISSLVINPANNHELFIATYGSGVFLYESPVVYVRDNSVPAGNYSLHQNYPNPFNPTTKVSFVIGHLSFVTLKVYDVLGQEVATLVNEKREAGRYEVIFSAEGGSASGGDGSKLTSGVYFYRLQARPIDGGQANDFIATMKLIIVK